MPIIIALSDLYSYSLERFLQSLQEHFLVHFRFVRKHSQYFLMHWLFLHAQPAPSIFVLLFSLNASGRFSNVPSIASCLIVLPSVFKHPTQVQTKGSQTTPFWKHLQYSLRHFERKQLHPCSPGRDLFAAGCPAFLKALGFLERIPWIAFFGVRRKRSYIQMGWSVWINFDMKHSFQLFVALTLERAPFGPLSLMVFKQFKQEHFKGSHRLPALKQSQYKAIHLDFGQLQPLGFSWRGPRSKVAEQSRSNLSNPPAIVAPFDFLFGGDADRLRALLFERFIWRSLSRLLAEGDIAFGIVMFWGNTTRDVWWETLRPILVEGSGNSWRWTLFIELPTRSEFVAPEAWPRAYSVLLPLVVHERDLESCAARLVGFWVPWGYHFVECCAWYHRGGGAPATEGR